MTDERRQRRDVVANRARIIEAATTVLREQGMTADMRAIATEAGVGIGTLYRHFPTRERLVHEITGLDLSRLASSSLPIDLSAIEALRHFFTHTIDQLASNRSLIDLLAGAEASDVDLERCMDHLSDVGRDALVRSEVDRTVAADVTSTDIARQFLALVRIVQILPPDHSGDIAHHIDLVLRGLEHKHPRP